MRRASWPPSIPWSPSSDGTAARRSSSFTTCEFDRLAPSLEIAAFRIVQECLTNACRYSQSPRRCEIALRQVDGRMRIEVQDWGIGFDPDRSSTAATSACEGIRERARLLGGMVAIHSAPGQGAHVTVELPLIPPVENGDK